ncbi:MAG: hypothetical protein KDA45_13595, partial [Planctomycetales bacterium]|nr:hypothetical protein [Planctomycetales bacterium]
MSSKPSEKPARQAGACLQLRIKKQSTAARMVRLKSEKWYSAAGQGSSRRLVASRVSGSRRMLSLCFLLGLVILLMQKAADPRHVRNAFQALGVPLEEAGSAGPAVPAETMSPVPLSLWDATCQDLLPRLLHTASTAQLLALSERWFSLTSRETGGSEQGSLPSGERSSGELSSSETTTSPATTGETLLRELQQSSQTALQEIIQQTRDAVQADPQQDTWLQALDAFEQQWQGLWDSHVLPSASPQTSDPATDNLSTAPTGVGGQPVTDPRFPQKSLEAALTNYLDQQLLGALRDARPWGKSEKIPFWRLLQRGQGTGRPAAPSDGTTPPLVNTRQLESEADIFRGQTVRFRGTVRRVERIESEQPALEMEAVYWLWWLRGEDDSLQPVAVYSPRALPDHLVQQIDDRAADYPLVEVQAISAKRLAYASSSGLQVAPTLFAGALTAHPQTTSPLGTVQPQAFWGQVRLALLGGCLLAAAILLPLLLPWRRGGPRRVASGQDRRPSPPSSPSAPQAKPQRPGGPPNRGGTAIVLLTATAFSLTASLTASSGDAQEKPAVPQPGATGSENVLPETVLPETVLPQDVPTASLQPPWARAAGEDPVLPLLAERLRASLDPAAIAELRNYMSGGTEMLPDAVLKVLRAVNQVGWDRALTIASPLQLDNGLQVRVVPLGGWVRLAMPVELRPEQQAWFLAQQTAEAGIYR